MSKLTKKQKALQGKVDSNKLYPLTDALSIVKECANAKFDESIDVAVQLGVDAKKSDQVVRGAVVLPNLAIVGLFLVPFIDRGKVVAVTKRKGAMAVVLIAGLGWAGLTAAAIRSTPSTPEIAEGEPAIWANLSPEELAAIVQRFSNRERRFGGATK